MFRHPHPAIEPDGVYIELVSALFNVLIPTLIMTTTFVLVAAYCYAIADSHIRSTIAVLCAVGTATNLSKIQLIVEYRRVQLRENFSISATAVWEKRFKVFSWMFSATVGGIAASGFSLLDSAAHVLSTGLVFGYCAGVVTRGLVRPIICVVSLLLATTPLIVSATMYGSLGYLMIAAIFVVFVIGGIETVFGGYRTIVEQIRQRNDMASIARQDTLTGLANRLGLRESFTRLLGTNDQRSRLAVHCLDLDGFKPVNDRYGHPVGDAVLRQMSYRVRSMLGAGDIVARTGGDEFVVVQAIIHNTDEAEVFSRRLKRMIGIPYLVDGNRIIVGVSIGYAVSVSEDANLDNLLSIADAALYCAKRLNEP